MAFLENFYDDCEIFITGGSGVVGKALIEKLLRSCNVRKIYVLLRVRNNYSVEQRMEKLRNAQIFNVLRAEQPEKLDRLCAVPGDVALPKLGITAEYAQLMSNVSIIFHCAATVRFEEPLRIAVTLNVGGTLEALKFAETLTQLKVFMHVSTFYSNPYLTFVESKLYPPPMDWRTCCKLIQEIKDDEKLDALTRKIIVGFPNTYTFTKNLAESLVNEYRDRLPVSIFRPSVVLFALREPEPGFAPSIMGAMGLFCVVGAGILKSVYLNDKIRLDITPQDAGIKLMMFYAFKTNEIYKIGTPTELPIYMCSSCNHIKTTFKNLAEQMEKFDLWREYIFEKNFLIPGCFYTTSRLIYLFIVFTKQIIPALMMDTLLILFGCKPALMAVVRKAYLTLEVMQPFLFNEYESSGITDQSEVFSALKNTKFDVGIDFDSSSSESQILYFCRLMVKSLRKDLMKESPDTLQRARVILHIRSAVDCPRCGRLSFRIVEAWQRLERWIWLCIWRLLIFTGRLLVTALLVIYFAVLFEEYLTRECLNRCSTRNSHNSCDSICSLSDAIQDTLIVTQEEEEQIVQQQDEEDYNIQNWQPYKSFLE